MSPSRPRQPPPSSRTWQQGRAELAPGEVPKDRDERLTLRIGPGSVDQVAPSKVERPSVGARLIFENSTAYRKSVPTDLLSHTPSSRGMGIIWCITRLFVVASVWVSLC
jgi:hypothetical protein